MQRSLLLPFFLFLMMCAVGVAEEDKAPEELMKKLLTAIEKKNYEVFVESGDVGFKGALTQETFDDLHASFASKLSPGYKAELINSRKEGHVGLYVWSIQLKDPREEDLTLRLVLHENSVGGFWLK